MNMKTISKILLLGALTLSMFGAAFMLAPASAGAAPEEQVSLLQQPTPTVKPATNQDDPTASIVEEWDRFCVKKTPYTLLAIPENASYEIVPFEGTLPTIEPGSNNSGEFSCTTAGIFRGKQVVVCRGPQLVSFNLQVSADGKTEEYPVGLTFCPIKDPSAYKNN
jgi:hypothetical protein